MILYASKKLPAYDLLELAVREVWGWPALPEIVREEGGKPRFAHHPEAHFNLSHSGGLALCGLGSAPIGVDIQIVKSTWREGLPGRVCSREELLWLERQPHRWQAFAQLWALKECRVKYSGTGLRGDLRTIPIPLPECGNTLCQKDDLWFRLFSGEGWEGAICGQTPPPEELRWK